jgi:hypothetical protein
MLLWKSRYVPDSAPGPTSFEVLGATGGVGPPGSGLVISVAYTLYK